MTEQKKIRIMSMQRIVNYGSFLQAFALKGAIKKLGYKDVGFVDYRFEKDIIEPEKKSYAKKLTKLLTPLSLREKRKHKKEFKEKYSNYLRQLGIQEENYSTNADTLVIGSDEVFNCLQHYPVGYSRGLFGKGYEQSKVISYAASFGHTTLDQLAAHGIDKEIGNMLAKFDSISVRDNNSKTIVEKLAPNKKPVINLDPVLIGDFGNAFEKKIKYTNYIIVYAYTGRLTRNEEKTIRKFAKKHNKKIISLGFYQKCADYNLIVEPLEVLAYFKNADYVITDTFHGSVFSIKANTKFCTIIRDSNRNKLSYLLKKMHCEKQIANSFNDIESIYNTKINFTECNKIIKEETDRTMKYLKENL